MECFPPACRDKEAGALGELSQSPVHILLLTFVTRDGVRAAQSRRSLTLLCGAPVPPCALGCCAGTRLSLKSTFRDARQTPVTAA